MHPCRAGGTAGPAYRDPPGEAVGRTPSRTALLQQEPAAPHRELVIARTDAVLDSQSFPATQDTRHRRRQQRQAGEQEQAVETLPVHQREADRRRRQVVIRRTVQAGFLEQVAGQVPVGSAGRCRERSSRGSGSGRRLPPTRVHVTGRQEGGTPALAGQRGGRQGAVSSGASRHYRPSGSGPRSRAGCVQIRRLRWQCPLTCYAFRSRIGAKSEQVGDRRQGQDQRTRPALRTTRRKVRRTRRSSRWRAPT